MIVGQYVERWEKGLNLYAIGIRPLNNYTIDCMQTTAFCYYNMYIYVSVATSRISHVKPHSALVALLSPLAKRLNSSSAQNARRQLMKINYTRHRERARACKDDAPQMLRSVFSCLISVDAL